MKYKIFKTFDEFNNSGDYLLNGFSQDFVDRIGIDRFNEMVTNEKYKDNEGCWNCTECVSCESCYNCEYCEYCYNCEYCEYCYNCEYCEYCYNCEYCEYCDNCDKCFDCLYCSECDECSSLNFTKEKYDVDLSF